MPSSTAPSSKKTPLLPLYHSQLVALLEVMAPEEIQVQARGVVGFWNLYVQVGDRVHILTSTRAKFPRRFAKVQTIVDYLHDLGFIELTVHLTHVAPQVKRRRPDRSKALKALWKDAKDGGSKRAAGEPRKKVKSRALTA